MKKFAMVFLALATIIVAAWSCSNNTPSSSNPYTITSGAASTNTATSTATATATSTHVCTPTIFGSTSTSTANSTSPPDYTTVYFSDFSPTTNGTLTDIQAYMGIASNQTVQAALYTADGSGLPNTLVGASNQEVVNVASPEWVTFAISGNAALTSGTNYCICVCQTASGNATSVIFYSGTGTTNFGIATLNGSLSNVPVSANLYANFLQLHVDYCQ